MIVKDGHFLAFTVFKLSSVEGVSDRNDAGLSQPIVAGEWYSRSDHQHGCIWDLLVPSSLIFPCARHLCVFHQHVLSGDFVVRELQIPVVFAVISIFGAYVPDLHSWEWVVIRISDGDQKGMGSILLILDNELCKDNSVSGVNSQVANPPLNGWGLGHMHDESVIILIVGCCGLEALDIWSMSQFCLGIATKNLPSDSWLQELFNLFICAQVRQSD